MPSLAPTTRRRPARTALQYVPEHHQWAGTTASRIAPDRYSWMQAVHWARDYAARYRTGRDHGPRGFTRTTVRLAQELARLRVCRPGVAYLARRLGMTVRTVKYHLALLRETGLIAYRTKGSRIAGEGNRASEFVRIIPPSFDEALHLRTRPSSTLIRVICGIADEGRGLMSALGRKAQRIVRAPRRHSAARPAATPRCTLKGVGPDRSLTDGLPPIPPENGTAPTTTARARRTLNRVGQRYRLARQLVEQVSWLARADPARIAWVIRHVADAGWTATEVIAVLAQQPPASVVHRPSGFLAARLLGMELVLDTPAKRRALVAWWRDSPQATRERHADWNAPWRMPARRSVVREVRDALSRTSAPHTQEERVAAVTHDGLADLTQLPAHEIALLRAAAQQDPALVRATTELCGEHFARRLFGHQTVDRSIRLASTGRLRLHPGHRP